MWLLLAILDVLFPLTTAERLILRADGFGECIEPVTTEQGAVALLPYRNALVKACITRAKFHNSARAQYLLAGVLFEYLREWSADRAPLDSSRLVVVPVPLSPTRMKERGFNQTERIARMAGLESLGIQVDTNLLRRVRDTPPQTSLGQRARRQNMQGAFETVGIPHPTDTYIVFDDVLTTGTTLLAARAALQAAGARRTHGLTLAH